MEILFLDRSTLQELLSMKEILEAVEEVFKQKGIGQVVMPPKVYVRLERYHGDFRAMPAYLPKIDAAGVKIVNAHPRNPETADLPSVMACILLIDPKTGAPLCLMEGGWLTAMRTGAAGGVAAKYLAREDSETVAMIGAGVQARTQLLALDHVLDNIREVRVVDRNEYVRERYAEDMRRETNADIVSCSKVEDALQETDILVTVTPSTSPLVKNSWVSNGTHVNAIGADAPGKQELDPEILRRAKIVVDDFDQATHSGEVNVPLTEGALSRSDIYAELGEIVAGKESGRTSADEVTLFDSTGLAIQDISTAWCAYELAEKKNVGEWLRLW